MVWFNMSANHLTNRMLLVPIACFPALSTDCLFSHAWYRMLVLPRLVPIAYVSMLVTYRRFSRAWCRLHVLPRLVPIACSPAFGAECIFSYAWCRLHVFPRLVQIACIPALGADCMFSRAGAGHEYFLYGLTGSCTVSICCDGCCTCFLVCLTTLH